VEPIGQAAAPRLGNDVQALQPSWRRADQANGSVAAFGDQDADFGGGKRGSPSRGHGLHRVGMLVRWKDVVERCQLCRVLDGDQRLDVLW
jgi:hypothetical protein